jgi:hypothetical protein
MLKLSNLSSFNGLAPGGGGGGGGVQISLEDNGNSSELPRSVSLGSAIASRLIVIAYLDVQQALGSIPTDTTLTLGGNTMTRVSTLTSGLSGSPQTDGYNCTFYYLQVDSGTSASLARSGGTTHGAFEVYRLTGWTGAAPAHSDGTGTTSGPAVSLSRTIAIPANGGLIAAAYAITSASHTYTGASRVLNGNASGATRTVTAADASHTVTVDRGSTGGLFFIVGSWG